MDISYLHTTIVTTKDNGKLFGIVCRNTSGMKKVSTCADHLATFFVLKFKFKAGASNAIEACIGLCHHTFWCVLLAAVTTVIGLRLQAILVIKEIVF